VQVPGYQVHRRIGGGGVGDVFHAVRVAPGGFRKPVALKRLKLDHAIDARMVQRFFAEARISAQLEHPNVVRVHDLLVVDDGYFIVMELLRGHTMAALEGRDRPWWLAFAIAEQALAGLEYAHALADEHGRRLGLVHRDLTPRNVFVCDTGVVKILDFGIAKLRAALSQAFTRDGVPMGTLEFLSPEQARGEPADPRADLYQLAGSVYWMLTGEYPHGSGTPAELVARAMTGAVRPVRELRADVPEPAAAALMRALAPRAEDRPADAAAMRAALREALREVADCSPAAIAKLLPASPPLEEVEAPDSSEPARSADLAIAEPRVPVSPLAPTAVARPVAPRRRWLAAALVLAGLAAGAIGAFAVSRAFVAEPAVGEPPEYKRLTFRRGALYTARFTADGDELVYSARWGEDPTQVFRAAPDSPDADALENLSGADVLAVSATGTLAVIHDVTVYGYSRRGTLAHASLGGRAPRDVVEDVEHADFAPDGETMAIVRWVDDRPRLEYPIGTVLHEAPAAGWIGEIRISPRADRVAFIEHPMVGDDRGSIAIVDAAGVTTTLSGEYTSVRGLAWAPGGDEIYFTAAEGGPRGLHAVTPAGRRRIVERAPAQLTLLDVSSDGRILLRQDVAELRTIGQPPDGAPRDLSWLNFSFPASVSDDGEWLTMIESGSELGGPALYRRRLDGTTPAVMITEAPAGITSPDGRWVLGGRGTTDHLYKIPTGAGEATLLIGPGTGDFVTGDWSRDGKRLFLFAARDKALRAYWYDLEAGALHPVPRDGIRFTMRGHVLDPDGARAVVIDEATDMLAIVTLADGTLLPVVGAQPGENFASWSDDGRFLYVAALSTAPLVVSRLDPVTGERTPWRTLMPEDPVGVEQITQLEMSRDGRAFAYSYHRVLSTLYLVTDSTPSR
jgi:serine/threonine-protein kinase